MPLRSQPVLDGIDAAVHGKVKRCGPQQIDVQRCAAGKVYGGGFILTGTATLFTLTAAQARKTVLRCLFTDKAGEFFQSEENAALVVVHAVCRQRERGNARLFLDDAAEGTAVRGNHVGNLRGNQADEVRPELAGGTDDFADELVIAAENGVLLCEARDENQAFFCIPARLIVGRVCRVAARRVVDDDHAAELVKCRADSKGIGRIRRNDAGRLLHGVFLWIHHKIHGPPSPLWLTLASMSLGF